MNTYLRLLSRLLSMSQNIKPFVKLHLVLPLNQENQEIENIKEVTSGFADVTLLNWGSIKNNGQFT